ncbi:hypothetical protein [Roseitranquillus sediminis]|uniref:hypothetical protein n=1 Tax=Roseitranquillus sediminis TaxID=2809051 RepID=UPI001D0C33AB|nr:hypothetical protein [Roseitranquillus sediminis]MBM9593239.1 hypothetical protein [Roseitranquillus sediminis]
MERHILDRPRSPQSGRLPHYLTQERDNRVRGPHHAVNVLRRLPRGSGELSHRMRSYLKIERST